MKKIRIFVPVILSVLSLLINILSFGFTTDDNVYRIGVNLYQIIVTWISTIILIYIYKHLFKMDVASFGAKEKISKQQIICLFMMVPGYYVLKNRMLGAFLGGNIPWTESGSLSYAQIIIVSFPALVAVPFLEEIIFRLGMIGSQKGKMGKLYGLLFSSFLFSIFHAGNQMRRWDTFIVAFSLGIVFIITENIWYSIIIHIGINSFVFILAVADKFVSGLHNMQEGYLAVSHDGVVQVHPILFWILLVVSMVTTWFYLRRMVFVRQ